MGKTRRRGGGGYGTQVHINKLSKIGAFTACFCSRQYGRGTVGRKYDLRAFRHEVVSRYTPRKSWQVRESNKHRATTFPEYVRGVASLHPASPGPCKHSIHLEGFPTSEGFAALLLRRSPCLGGRHQAQSRTSTYRSVGRICNLEGRRSRRSRPDPTRRPRHPTVLARPNPSRSPIAVRSIFDKNGRKSRVAT